MSEAILAYFMALLYKEGLSTGTVKSYLSAARYIQVSMGSENPNITGMLQLEFALKGFKRLAGSGQR